MKASLTRTEVLEFEQYFEQAILSIKNAPFKVNYAITKNQKLIDDEAKVIKKALEPSKEFIEFNEKRIALAKEYADKDEVGKPIMEGTPPQQKFKLTTNEKVFNEKYDALKAEYQAIIDIYEKNYSKENMDERVDFDFHAVSLSLVENLVLDGVVAKVLALFVTDAPDFKVVNHL
jgi:hypothetical protein